LSELNEEILDVVEDGNVEDVSEDDIRDSLVITVPIDSTLSISGAAADARAAGQAIAAKASESDVKTLLSVNGRTGNGAWAIMVNGGNIPASSDEDTEMVSDALDRLAGAIHDEEVARMQSLLQVYNRITPLEAHAGFVIYIPFAADATLPLTVTVRNTAITVNHYLTGATFVDGQENLVDDVLADFQWSTSDGGLEVIIGKVYASGTMVLDFGWRQQISGSQASGGGT